MTIGAAAARIGVPTHVLRHWEDMRLVSPGRTAGGRRLYTEEHVCRLLIVRSCREVGLSLSEIGRVLDRGAEGRRQAIDERLRAIRRQRAELDAAEVFLTHVQDCRHDLMTRCPDCSRYADREPG